nr:glycosyl hydrolase 115 family protein [Prolixibacteraceae bacterium]
MKSKAFNSFFFKSLVSLGLIIVLLSCSSNSSSNNEIKSINSISEYISFKKEKNSFTLSENGISTPIVVDAQDYPGVFRVLEYFKSDIAKVTNVEPKIIIGDLPQSDQVIIVGTLGESKLIDQLIADKKIDVSDIEGKWENSLIEVVENPAEGIDKALVIVGSDKRGTIYGIFDISRKMGVSPWYWWADVAVVQHENVYVKAGRYNLGEPKVKYRGIFLNDEEPALGRWAVENYGGFNHQFYEKVFELMLRSKANYLWPAMWWASFYTNDPMNMKLADELGIVMGTSHHEPMDLSHAEWKAKKDKGAWNYETNAEELREFWREGIERIGDREVIVNMAMRGDGDVGMSDETNTELLERIVKDQREIIEDVTGKPAAETPQMWALYKEVQDYYDEGMRVPDDVTLLLCDDNWGNIRKLPAPDAPERSGGYGIYYHFDFVGGPRSYKWINVSPIPRIWEQMNLAYQHGVDRLWLVNVGDLKPMELPISFFLDFAWNPDLITINELDSYTTNWAKEQFGKEYAKETAEILDLYTKYNGRRTPEMLYSNTYSLVNYREFETVVNDYRELAQKAEKIYNSISEEMKPSFYQLVYQPTVACANLYEMYYAHGLNQLYAKQGRAATNDMAKKVEELFNVDADITDYFHTKLLDGKWNHMMAQTHIGYKSWNDPAKNIMPKVEELQLPKSAEMGVAIEGSNLAWPKAETEAILPEFDSYNDQSFYIEVFNKGEKSFRYTISSADWVIISDKRGSIKDQQRVEISVDWKKISKGENTTEIHIKGNDTEQVVKLIARKYEGEKPKGFVERNGYVSIDATKYSKAIEGKNIQWDIIPDMGRTGSAITTFPVTKSVDKPGIGTPGLEYDFYLLDTPKDNQIDVDVYISSTLNFKGGSGLQFAVSVDNGEPQLVNIHEGTEVPDWKYPWWFNKAVSEKVMIKNATIELASAGQHKLKIWMVDNAVIYQKRVIKTEDIPFSYLGAPES